MSADNKAEYNELPDRDIVDGGLLVRGGSGSLISTTRGRKSTRKLVRGSKSALCNLTNTFRNAIKILKHIRVRL